MILLVICIISCLISAQGQNLSKIIVEGQKNGIVNITLGIGTYFLYNEVQVRNIKIFNLVGNNSTVSCIQKEEIANWSHVLGLENVSEITIEGIYFTDCNRNLEGIREPPQATPLFLRFTKCGSVRIRKCEFINVNGINILSYNSINLSVVDSEFRNTNGKQSKAILQFSNNTGIKFSTLEVRRNVFKGKTWVSDYYNDQGDDAIFAVKCGSSVSAFFKSLSKSSIEIEDNEFIDNQAIQGGSVCIWIHENQALSKIKIDKANFINGIAASNVSREEYHERPAGGAIALFMYGSGVELTISNCNFTNNKGYRSGALYMDYSMPNSEIIDNCHFENNTGQLGGALMITSTLIPDEVSVELRDNFFIGNTAEFGGAILAQRVNLIINGDVIIASNHVLKGDGGGMGLIYSKVFVNGSLTIRNNSAGRTGGGIHMSSKGQIRLGHHNTSLEVIGNNAWTYGGGIYAHSLNYENTIDLWGNTKEEIRRKCFLLGVEGGKIVMQGNKAWKENKACAGNMIYTQLLTKCLKADIINGTLVVDKGECNNDTKEESFEIEISHLSRIECRKSLFTEANKYAPLNNQFGLSTYCSNSGKINPFAMESDHITPKIVTDLHKDYPHINTFYYIYQGFKGEVNISSKDYFGYNVVTRSTLYGKIYSDGRHIANTTDFEPILLDHENTHQSFLTNLSTSIMLKSRWKGLGVLCVQSIDGFSKKKKCIGIVMGECPPGFELRKEPKKDECVCSNKKWYTCSGINLTINPGDYMANKYTIKDLDKPTRLNCRWYRCKCHFGAPKNACIFNPMIPDEQCLSGLKGPLCGNCTNPNHTLFFSPFLNSYKSYSSCIECKHQVWKMAGIIFITLSICIIIMVLKLNLLDDYWRSIIFYANILYIIYVNSNQYISQTVNTGLAILILPLNFLVTQMIPFCLYPGNHLIYAVLWDMVVPLVLLFLFFLLQRFILTRVSCLSLRDVPTQIWSMLLLTYTDLSIHAFMILDCPVIGKARYWAFNVDIICYQKIHLVATVISLLYLYALFTIPSFLLFITYCTKKDFQFHHNLTKRFKHQFRWWEIYKLYLRFTISLIITFIPNFIDQNIPIIIVSVLCLSSMILNSLLEPANNRLSNYFESLCFLCLALATIQGNAIIFCVAAVTPFLVGAVLILLEQKIPLWTGKFTKIKAQRGTERKLKDKIWKIFKILDTSNKFELEAIQY